MRGRDLNMWPFLFRYLSKARIGAMSGEAGLGVACLGDEFELAGGSQIRYLDSIVSFQVGSGLLRENRNDSAGYNR